MLSVVLDIPLAAQVLSFSQIISRREKVELNCLSFHLILSYSNSILLDAEAGELGTETSFLLRLRDINSCADAFLCLVAKSE